MQKVVLVKKFQAMSVLGGNSCGND